jgi:hypothetical protein
VGLPCRLVRGSSYCGKEDDAMVVIKCGDERYLSNSIVVCFEKIYMTLPVL